MELKKLSKENLKKIIADPVLFSEHVLNLPSVSETEEKILRSKAKRICIAAGRRWGKTTMLAIFSVWFALTQIKEKEGIIIFTPSWEQCEIIMDAVKDIISCIHPVVRKSIRTHSKTYETTINNRTIISRSATKTSRSIRGHGAKIRLLIRDEDAFIPDSMMKAIRPIRLSNSAKEIVASSTAGHNHFYKDWHSKVYESYRVTTYDNKFLDKKEIDEEKQLLTKAEFDQEYMAEFMDDRYSVFPQNIIDEATDFDKKFTDNPSDSIEYVMGVDLGRRRDATVVVVGHAELNHIHIDYVKEIVYLQDGRFWSNALKEIKLIAQKYHVTKIHIDQTGIGDKPTEDLRNSIADHNLLTEVKGIDFTTRIKNSKTGLINSLLLKFERKEIHFPFCEKLIRQLKNIRFEAQNPSISNATSGRFTHVGHDDFVIALTLCVNALPQTAELFYSISSASPQVEQFNQMQSSNPFESPQLIITNQEHNE
jgi:phage terminase large subunit-like protein